MDQLEVLDGKKPGPGLQAMLPIISWDVHTPLNLEQWIRELSDHPDTSFANYILDGIHRGFTSKGRHHLVAPVCRKVEWYLTVVGLRPSKE